MQQVRKLHLPTEIQIMSKVFVVLEHVLMKRGLLFPFNSYDKIFLVSGHGYCNWFCTVIPSENLYEAKIFIRNNSSILKNHLRNSVCFFLDLLFSNKVQNYEIDISVTLVWKIFTCTGFFFHRKQEVAIIIISSVLVYMNSNANFFSFLWFLYSRRRRSKN